LNATSRITWIRAEEYATQDNVEHLIQARAHQLWEEDGRPEERAEHHWYQARKLVDVEGTKEPRKKAAGRSTKAKSRKN
jgi:Protein of unknown function (DUF2934)